MNGRRNMYRSANKKVHSHQAHTQHSTSHSHIYNAYMHICIWTHFYEENERQQRRNTLTHTHSGFHSQSFEPLMRMYLATATARGIFLFVCATFYIAVTCILFVRLHVIFVLVCQVFWRLSIFRLCENVSYLWTLARTVYLLWLHLYNFLAGAVVVIICIVWFLVSVLNWIWLT